MQAVRKNVTQPEDWWAAFQAEAKRNGQTLSEWVGAACFAQLPHRKAKQLSDRPPANRPKKKTDQ